MKTLRLLLVCYLVLSCSSIVLANAKEVSLKTSTGTLYGTLESPTDATDVVALIIAGSGPTDRDGNTSAIPGKNNSLKMLAESLTELGYASLRTDKRGVAASQDAGPEEADLRFDTYVSDMVDWLIYLRDIEDYKKIVIIGHSEGSLIGMLAAQDAVIQDSIVGFISLAGTGFPAQDTLRTQLAEQLNTPMLEGVEEVLTSLEKGELVDTLPSSIASVKPIAALFRDSVQPYLVSWFAYDPSEVITDLNIPILIVQGNHDIQVSEKDAEMLHAANENSELSIIKGMNHIFKKAPKQRMLNLATYANPTLKLADGFMDTIETFLEEALVE